MNKLLLNFTFSNGSFPLTSTYLSKNFSKDITMMSIRPIRKAILTAVKGNTITKIVIVHIRIACHYIIL